MQCALYLLYCVETGIPLLELHFGEEEEWGVSQIQPVGVVGGDNQIENSHIFHTLLA